MVNLIVWLTFSVLGQKYLATLVQKIETECENWCLAWLKYFEFGGGDLFGLF